MNRQWLGRKGHRSLPCQEKGTGQGMVSKSKKGFRQHLTASQQMRILPVPSQKWLVWTMLNSDSYVTTLNHVRAALDSNELMGRFVCNRSEVNKPCRLAARLIGSLIRGAAVIALSTLIKPQAQERGGERNTKMLGHGHLSTSDLVR